MVVAGIVVIVVIGYLLISGPGGPSEAAPNPTAVHGLESAV
jgi:hypothetical protein